MVDAGAVDTELNEILLKTDDESLSDSTTHHNTHLFGEVEQQVKHPQRRNNVHIKFYVSTMSALLTGCYRLSMWLCLFAILCSQNC